MDNIRMNQDDLLKSQMLRRMTPSHHELCRREIIMDTVMIGAWILIAVTAVAVIWVC